MHRHKLLPHIGVVSLQAFYLETLAVPLKRRHYRRLAVIAALGRLEVRLLLLGQVADSPCGLFLMPTAGCLALAALVLGRLDPTASP